MTQSNSSSEQTICFIGSGNMARSLIGGLINSQYPADKIIACDIHQDKLDALAQEFNIRTQTDNKAALKQSDIVVLSVKPQILQQVCTQLAGSQSSNLFISIAAGIREPDINRWLGGNQAIVRCMPNTPALIGLGASALYANAAVSQGQKQQAEKILHSAGITVWVEQESELDAVTAISGSGPAYFFLFIEALQQAGIKLGLSAETAGKLAKQTALGAASMAQQGDVTTLREQVTSRGGTTEQAIASFQQNGLEKIVQQATEAAAQRSVELAKILAK